MNWTKFKGNPKDLQDLPMGTLVRVEYENYDLDYEIVIRVLGNGEIFNNKCGQPDENWEYYEADWSNLDWGGKVVEYALPPKEYIDFLSINTKNKGEH